METNNYKTQQDSERNPGHLDHLIISYFVNKSTMYLALLAKVQKAYVYTCSLKSNSFIEMLMIRNGMYSLYKTAKTFNLCIIGFR